MLCTGFPAMLDAMAARRNSLRSLAAHCAQTAAASQFTKRARRAAMASALLGTLQVAPTLAHTRLGRVMAGKPPVVLQQCGLAAAGLALCGRFSGVAVSDGLELGAPVARFVN